MLIATLALSLTEKMQQTTLVAAKAIVHCQQICLNLILFRHMGFNYTVKLISIDLGRVII
jgi:hypothetical protein|tara:strand:- start:6 stop:185 length:180 start_codon:yes stop_codon:yes gene_type:complete